MPRVEYVRVAQGFRPYTNPRPLKGLRGLDYLGDANCDAGMPYDVNGNPCPGGQVQLAGAPTGSQLLYSATWQIPSAHAFTTPAQILASVLQVLKGSASIIGFQVVNASQSGGLTTVSNFGVQIQLFVSGPGFAQPNDAGSYVDHAYNQVTGLMPVVSSTVVTQLPAGVAAAPAPTGTSPFPSSAGSQLASWFENNAIWIGLGIAAIVVLPKLL